MATPYKLTYFNLKGRAEAARCMLSMAGQEFEDVRLEFNEWAAFKPSTPQGFLPVLETASGKISQSIAINMFVAEKFEYLPETAYEKSQTISILLTLNDLSSLLGANLYKALLYKLTPVSDDIEDKKRLSREEIAKCMKYIEEVTQPEAKFLFGSKITVADINLLCTLETIFLVLPETKTHSPWVERFLANMYADTEVAKYLDARPASIA